ncbi:serine/threonine-protein kinase PknK [Persicimonas caeni]|uniref:Serine/threonine-protein kinase PknK n=1 Tax=Persicimonas caeni TaxID=2292766 RepID=A0A4Y6PP89_PERCE|nr:serine/threonine-protein kinase [Persicimonas caeni]QDG50138.1 serine/threonine-protein kinase PknK [Persicimonas caeni]QED31359.1 serine/threonine-protein kinase PknK [Persicimonas caeni]
MRHLGSFKLHNRLGRGGMGEVWRAEHEPTGEVFAVKVIRRGLGNAGKYMRAFEREVRATARLDHPGVVRIVDYGVIEPSTGAMSGWNVGTPWFAMEYASQGNLENLMRYMTWSTVKSVLVSVLDALAHSHARGLVHRDIKPSNILLDGSGEHVRVLLSDFGLVHAVGRGGAGEPSHTQERSGTPSYMAPEQVRGDWRDFGPWTDLYALGCVAYELACGRPPFEANNAPGMWLKHLEAPVPPLEATIGVPDGFERWLQRLLAKEPARRFQCAADAAWNLLLLGDVDDESLDVEFGGVASHADAKTWTHLPGPISPDKMSPDKMSPDKMSPGDVSPVDKTASLSGAPAPPVQTTRALDSLLSARTDGVGLWSQTSHGEETSAPFSSRPTTGRKRIDPRGVSFSDHAIVPDYEMPALARSWHTEADAVDVRRRGRTSLGLLGLRRPPLVGRERERDVLWGELSRVFSTRTTRGVIVGGPAGVGKARVLGWFVQRAQEVGAAKVLRIPESEASGAGDALRLALCDHLRTWGLSRSECRQRIQTYIDERLTTDDPEIVELLERVDVPALAQLMTPSGARRAADEPAFHFSEPTQKWSVIARFLTLEAALRPLIVWIDGANSQSQSLDLARYLLVQEHLAEMGCMIVISLRDAQAVELQGTGGRLAELVGHDAVVELPLEPMGDAEQRRVVEDLLELHPDLVDRIHRHARGSMLFAVHLVNHLVERDMLRRSERGYRLADAEQPFPKDFDELWQARLDQLIGALPGTGTDTGADKVWAALEAAAALGESFSREEYGALVDTLELTVPERLWDELSRQGLASATPTGWRMAEESLRHMLEKRSKRVGRWAPINAAVARLLVSEGLSANAMQRRALHLRRAGFCEAALEPLREAGRELMQEASFEQARTCLNQYRELVDSLQLDGNDPRRTADLALQAEIARIIGDPGEARRWVGLFLEEAAYVDDPTGLGTVLYVLAELDRLDGEVERGAYFYEHAAHLFKRVYHVEGQVRAWSGEAWMRGFAGELEQAEALFTHAIDTARQLPTRPVRAELAWCYQGLAEFAWIRGQQGRAAQYNHRAERLARAVGAPVYIGMARRLQADLALERGDEQEAWIGYRSALDMLLAVNSRLADLARTGAVLAAMKAERFDEADELLAPLERVTRIDGRYTYRLLFHVMQLPLLAHRGDIGAWDVEFARTQQLLDEMSFIFPYVPQALELAAELLEAAGHHERAQRATNVGRTQWRRLGR